MGSALSKYIQNISESDKLWLETIYGENLQNRRISVARTRSILRNKLPKTYSPAQIDQVLIDQSYEEITPLGIVAITGSDAIMEKGDKVVESLRHIVLDNPDIQMVSTVDIANHSNVPLNEVGLLIHFLWNYGRLFQSYGSKKEGYFGAEFVMFDRYNKEGIMQFTNMRDQLITQLEQKGFSIDGNESSEIEAEDQRRVSTGLQVLAVHYLLKASGVESTEYKMETAKLIQFLTNRELGAKRIQDTAIYRKVSQPFKLSDKALLKDLQTIRQLFVNLGLIQVVKYIDHEILDIQGLSERPSKKRAAISGYPPIGPLPKIATTLLQKK